MFPSPRSRLRIWSPEVGSGVPSRVTLLILLRLNLVLTHGIPPDFRGGVHFFFKTAARHRDDSAEFIGSRNYVPMVFTAERVRRHRASKPQGGSNKGGSYGNKILYKNLDLT